MIRAFGAVKAACVVVNAELGYIPRDRADAILRACEEMTRGELDRHIIVECLQGGAGTSLNMCVNEVLANRALQILGHEPGRYDIIHPADTVNLHQSTNDTYPTALKVAALYGLFDLEEAATALLEAFQDAEKRFAGVAKVGRTQLRDAVPITLGREMGAYAEAFARDRWRIFKCRERIRVVNLGGNAIGTGVTAPRQFIFRVTDKLREMTTLPVSRSENLVETTQNADVFVEVAGILKAFATDLIKVGNDLRLLSSGPRAGLGEIELPAVQEGSSIMPGKVNPVIPEYAVQAGMVVYGFENIIALAAASGNLELNAFLPAICWSLLSSIDLLADASRKLASRCVTGIRANTARTSADLRNSTAAAVMLVPIIGHDAASRIALKAIEQGLPLEQAVLEEGILTREQWEELISPQRLNSLGER
jgi:aspartate ammonia-lyase